MVSQLLPLPEALLQLSLLYALHADEQLDVESIARKLTNHPELQNKAMSLAQQISLLDLESRFRSLEAGYDAKFKQS